MLPCLEHMHQVYGSGACLVDGLNRSGDDSQIRKNFLVCSEKIKTLSVRVIFVRLWNRSNNNVICPNKLPLLGFANCNRQRGKRHKVVNDQPGQQCLNQTTRLMQLSIDHAHIVQWHMLFIHYESEQIRHAFHDMSRLMDNEGHRCISLLRGKLE